MTFVRGLNWIDDVMSEVEDVETPRSWLWWSLCAAVSAAAGNNYQVVTISGKVVYKPNIYVILLGDSGLGKGFGINLAKKLILAAGPITRCIAGRSSIQAIIQELGTFRSSENGPPLFKDSRGFIVNGELSSAVITDPDVLTILTDLFDGNYNDEWTNMLKGDGQKKLISPCITALFGSSQSHFYEKIPQANIEGGFVGRTLIIYEEKRHKNIDLLDSNATDDKLKDYVIPEYSKHLRAIASGKGRLIPDENAKGIFNSWRHKWRAEQRPDKTGFLNRVPDHVLKVSMCIALSRYDQNLEITGEDILTAIDKVTGLVYANRISTEGKGLDVLAIQQKMVLDLLIAAEGHRLRRKLMLSRGTGTLNTFNLEQVTENLLEMGWITREREGVGSNSDWVYTLSGEPLQRYEEWKRRNQK